MVAIPFTVGSERAGGYRRVHLRLVVAESKEHPRSPADGHPSFAAIQRNRSASRYRSNPVAADPLIGHHAELLIVEQAGVAMGGTAWARALDLDNFSRRLCR